MDTILDSTQRASTLLSHDGQLSRIPVASPFGGAVRKPSNLPQDAPEVRTVSTLDRRANRLAWAKGQAASCLPVRLGACPQDTQNRRAGIKPRPAAVSFTGGATPARGGGRRNWSGGDRENRRRVVRSPAVVVGANPVVKTRSLPKPGHVVRKHVPHVQILKSGHERLKVLAGGNV